MSTRIQRSSVHRGVIILCLLGVLTISVLILLAIIVGVGDFETSRVLSAHFDDNRLKATRASQYQALGEISNSTVLTDFSVASLFSYTALIALIIIVCLGLTWFQRLSQTCAIAQKRAKDLESTLRHIDQGVIMVDTHGEIVVMNEKVGALLELPKPLDSRRRQFNELIEYMLKRGEFGTMTRASSQAAMHQIRSLAPGLTQDYYERKRPDGTVLAVQSNRMPEGGFVRTIKDITEHHRSTEKIAHLSAHDPLTNLENRKMFQEKLALTLKKTALEIGLSVLIIDLDEFKIVNDSHGHAIGDALLRLVALRLRSAVRSGDSIARLGGDEFAILLPGLSDPKLALARAQHLIEVLREPYRVGDLLLTSTASIGCAIAPQNGESAEDLVQNADIALHSAKADGRNARRLFAPEMAQQLVKRRRIEEELASALVNDELELHYQPLVNLNSGKCCGCEALLRWNHPQRGRIPPLDFIPIAEDTGLILPIGRWVLRQAC